MVQVREELDFNDLQRRCWSGALDTLRTIEDYGLEERFMYFLGSYFLDEIPTMTELNDLLWFEDEFIYENIGLTLLDEEDEMPFR